MTKTSFTVSGMTCEHCVASVREEITELDGVREVAVDLATGQVSVTSEAPLSQRALNEAVQEAGYELVEA